MKQLLKDVSGSSRKSLKFCWHMDVKLILEMTQDGLLFSIRVLREHGADIGFIHGNSPYCFEEI